MENFDSEISSIDDETSSLVNTDSICDCDKNTDLLNGYGCKEDVEDTRSELKFDKELETPEELEKRQRIEEALSSDKSNIKTWQKLAIEKYGLVGDDLRAVIWPLLLGLDPNPDEKIMSLDELANHNEYNQVKLDVDRSLKRFPPGIPYKQRVALQDQLTVLILRVIMKYPNLNYYQGYHDVAITFLLVVKQAVAFRIMEKLSTEHLRECMEPTMEKTSHRLNYIYAILYKADPELHDFMDEAGVGTMFALPWYLTWFGHSLNQYRDVVRLYDFFLASPPLMPLYVATSLVIQRRMDIFAQDCDMASIHCVLSQIPDDLDFEVILENALKYFKKYPPEKLEVLVKKRVKREHEQRKKDEQRMRRRLNKNRGLWMKINSNLPPWLLFNTKGKYGLLLAAATVIIGFYAYYIKTTNPRFSFFGLFNT